MREIADIPLVLGYRWMRWIYGCHSLTHLPCFTCLRLDWSGLGQHGTGDKCVDVRCSRELFEGAQSRDKTLKEYEGKAHVLLSEDEETRERFLGDMTDWIKTHSL